MSKPSGSSKTDNQPEPKPWVRHINEYVWAIELRQAKANAQHQYK